MAKVTDPALLAELDGPGPVTDPALLAQLEGAQPPRVGRVESGARGAIQGPPLGFGDEVPAAVDAALPGFLRNSVSDEAVGQGQTYGERYRNARDYYRGQNAAARESNPKTYIGGELAGGLATAVAAPAGAARAPTLLGRMGQAAKVGAGIGGVAGAGASEADSLGGVAGDAAGGAAAGALFAPAVEAGVTGAKLGTQWLGRKMGGLATEAARRSTGATQVDITKLTRENPGRPAQIGEALIEEPIRLRSPETIGKDAGRIKSTVGQEIGSLVKTADQSGAQFDVGGFLGKARADVLDPLKANLAQRVPGHHGNPQNPVADRLGLFLDELEKKAQSQGGKLSVGDAHTLRKQLDELLRGVRRSQDPDATVIKAAFNDVRGMLSDEIGATMQRAGVGDQWAAANRRFSLASDIGKLSKKGQDRRLGNNAVFGFTQQVAGMGPGSVIGALSSPDDRMTGALAGAIAGAAGTRALQNYGAPVTARVAQRLARTLSSAPGAPGASSVLPSEIAALIQAMERGRSLRPVPVAADEERR